MHMCVRAATKPVNEGDEKFLIKVVTPTSGKAEHEDYAFEVFAKRLSGMRGGVVINLTIGLSSAYQLHPSVIHENQQSFDLLGAPSSG